MQFRRAVSIGIAITALVFVQALPGFQVEETQKVTKKAKRAAKQTREETGQAATEVGRKGSAAMGSAARATEGATNATGAAAGNAAAARTGAGRVTTASAEEISAARASGKVWVNTDTGVYHKGGQWYGATKHGKFMTEQEATQAGYHASKAKTK